MPKAQTTIGANTLEPLYVLIQVRSTDTKANSTEDEENEADEASVVRSLLQRLCAELAEQEAFCIFRTNAYVHEMHAYWPVVANSVPEARERAQYAITTFWANYGGGRACHVYKQSWSLFFFPENQVNGAGWWYLCRGPALGHLPDVIFNGVPYARDIRAWHYLWYNQPELASLREI